MRVVLTVEAGGEPLACARCLEKHLGAAAVLATEFEEEPDREAERALCIGHLICAEGHAQALGLGILEKIPNARMRFEESGKAAPVLALLPVATVSAVGELAAAEQHLRVAGKTDAAEEIRRIRLGLA